MHTLTATCPAGTWLLMGGFDTGDPGDMFFAASYPSSSTAFEGTWTVSLHTGNTGVTGFTMYALCSA